jgi:hypothetical protein
LIQKLRINLPNGKKIFEEKMPLFSKNLRMFQNNQEVVEFLTSKAVKIVFLPIKSNFFKIKIRMHNF